MKICSICYSDQFIEVFAVKKVPASANIPFANTKSPLEVFGELDIVMCRQCSHVFNRKFDIEVINQMYSQNYSSGLPNSEAAKASMQKIAEEAIGVANIAVDTVLEIGASDFSFSKLMLKLGARQVIGFEPSTLFKSNDPRIQHVNGYFTSESMKAIGNPPIQLLVVRHVLEHVPEPRDFLKQLASSLQIGARLYVEVPNLEDILQNSRVYDFFYEHLHYFSPQLLQSILEQIGFEVENFSQHKGGQHFGLLCRKVRADPESMTSFSIGIEGNRMERIANLKENIIQLKQAIGEVFKKYKRIAIYGAGNHAIAVTVMMDLNSSKVGCLFDLDDLKSGRFSPMSKIVIRKPTSESVNEFELIIIIAALYELEIYRHLRKCYNFKGVILGTYPSVRNLE
jgi:hypothetical protein